VFREFAVVLTAKDRITAGNIHIAGLPFTSRNTVHPAAVILSPRLPISISRRIYALTGVVNNDTQTISTLQSGANVTSPSLIVAAISDTSALRGSFWCVI
jgi:hypothetical protein